MTKGERMEATTFEQAMERLKMITDRLSDESLPLYEMVKLYEEGEALVKRCRALLDSYEARLIAIREDG